MLGDLEQFDALVGENACQIRAIRIALIAKSIAPSRLDAILCRAGEILKKIEELSSPASLNMLMQEGISLLGIIERHKLDLMLSSDEMFIFQSYLLCEARLCAVEGNFLPSIVRIERCSPKVMQNKHPHLSYSFFGKLTDSLRVRLSQASVGYVRKIASDLQDKILVRMVSEEFEIKHNSLACIPTFWCFKTLFSFSLKAGLPMIFHIKFLSRLIQGYQVIDEDFLCFKPWGVGFVETYVNVSFRDLDPTMPICMVEGVQNAGQRKGSISLKKEWRQIIKKRSPLEILLAAGADHRQYPDPERIVPIEDKEYSHFKRIAEKEGIALCNPTTFFVRHIYPSSFSSISKKIDSLSGKRLLGEQKL